MPWPVHPNGLLGASGNDSDTYRIERSLRFNTADSAYLTRNQTTPTTSGTFTLSFWLKRSSFTTDQVIFYGGSVRGTGQPGSDLYILAAGNLFIDNSTGSGNYTSYQSPGLLRDPSAWYHIVFNQTGATVNVYVNGVLFWNTTTTASNYFNSGVLHYIGTGAISNPITNFLSAYLAEMHFVDGQVLTPSSFGETDAITGRWKAKAYSGTYGANGFYLKFADNSAATAAALGKDSAGTNNFTPVNISVATSTLADKVANDSLVDSPTNYGTDTGVGGEVRGNYATLNPISTIRSTIIDGALRTNAGDRGSISTIGMTSGKWYCEMYVTALGAECSTGISQGINIMNTYVGSSSDSWGYYYNGLKYNNASSSSYGSSYTTGDTIGVAFDASAGTLVFYKNGTSQGTAYTSLTSGPYYFATSGRSSTSANDVTMNFGQQAWRFAPPTGFKALCTTNLPTPTIQKPSKFFDITTRTSDGASNYTKTGLEFSPDFIWTKDRTSAYDNILWDSVRGATKYLISNTTGTELTAGQLASFNSNGYTINYGMGQANFSTDRYVDWIWDAGSSDVTNNSGSITSTVRANPQAGVSICTFNVGASGAKTFGHGLSTAPRMVIVKSRTSAVGWSTYHASVITATNQYIQLNTTAAILSVAGIWGSALPTSSVVGIGSGTNVNANDDCVAYCFSEVEGFSKFGSYTGNASADGPFIYCGFRPKLIIGKRTDAVENWIIYDTSRDSFNVASAQLQPNTLIAETTANSLIDFNSNGFKFRSTNSFNGNSSGGTHIFMAFAESPFKYARAR
jgi:hypothetical protein